MEAPAAPTMACTDRDLLSALPEGPKESILLRGRMSARDYAALGSVNRAWRDTALRDASLWRALGRAHFGDAMEELTKAPADPDKAPTGTDSAGAGAGAASAPPLAVTSGSAATPSESSVGRWAWKDAYVRSRDRYGRVSICTTDITWGGTPQYWNSSEPDASSPFGRVALCKAVCFFDIAGRTAPLLPGGYRAFLRLSGPRRPPGEDVFVSAHVEGHGEDGFTRIIRPDEWPGDNRWLIFGLGNISVPAESSGVVVFRMHRHGGSWICNLKVDYVHFQRADSE